MITFDQLLDIQLDNTEPEEGQRLQGDIHAFSAAMFEWAVGNLEGANLVSMFNIDNTDPELSTVSAFVGGLTRANILALQQALILGRIGAPGYDKTYLRSRFGL